MGHYIKALKLAPRTPTAAVCHTNLGSSLYKLVRGVAAVCVVLGGVHGYLGVAGST